MPTTTCESDKDLAMIRFILLHKRRKYYNEDGVKEHSARVKVVDELLRDIKEAGITWPGEIKHG